MLTTIIEEKERRKHINHECLVYLNKDLSPGVVKNSPHSLATAHEVFPETKEYFSFGVLRDPFKRSISGFRYHKAQAIEKAIKSIPEKEIEINLQEQFLNYLNSKQGIGLAHKGRDLFNYCDKDGNQFNVNRILKLETLNETLEDCLGDQGMQIKFEDIPRLKSDFKKIPDTINLWSRENINVVVNRHEWEFRYLNYPTAPKTN